MLLHLRNLVLPGLSKWLILPKKNVFHCIKQQFLFVTVELRDSQTQQIANKNIVWL